MDAHRPEQPTMSIHVEVTGLNDASHVVNRFIGQQDAAKNTPLGFNVLWRETVDD
jgi:hypothetical protein